MEPVSPFPIIFLLILLSVVHLRRLSGDDRWYADCGNLFRCGGIDGVGYPFWGEGRPRECGLPGLELDCDDGVIEIEIMSLNYDVVSINQASQVLTLAREDLKDDICLEEFRNTTLDPNLFDYVSGGYQNLTFLYGCPPEAATTTDIAGRFTCSVRGINYEDAFARIGSTGPGNCHASVVVPIDTRVSSRALGGPAGMSQAVSGGFPVRWRVDRRACGDCERSNGRCGYDHGTNRFVCLCPNQPPSSTGCRNGNSTERRSSDDRGVVTTSSPPQAGSSPSSGNSHSNNVTPRNIALPIAGTVVASLCVGWVIFFVRQRKKRLAAAHRSSSSSSFQPGTGKKLPIFTIPATKRKISDVRPPPPPLPRPLLSPPPPPPKLEYPSSNSNVMGKMGSSHYYGVQVFSHSELEEATDNFSPSKELGDGGFGTVYYGKLKDGRTVAVKRLHVNSFKRVEQFLNEVEILTRLRHPNLVTLYGCTSKRSKDLILVYEFVSNGTVADHLHGKLSRSSSSSGAFLPWPIRLNIAVEAADALAYLHASDIIHRDVKTDNILLDADCHVKVADFGLSRLFPTHATHVSTAPQGTPGYVDPEYYQCFQLTEKSDVYSFGVVLVELVSSLPAVDTNRSRNDINLASMAIGRIQSKSVGELVDSRLGFGKDDSLRRTATKVAELAFRCLQQERAMRPSMEQVLADLREIRIEAAAEGGAAPPFEKGNHCPPPLSPDSVGFKWTSSSTAASSG